MKMKVKRVCLSQHQKSKRGFLLLTQGISSYSCSCLQNRSRSCLKCQVENKKSHCHIAYFLWPLDGNIGHSKSVYQVILKLKLCIWILYKPCDFTRFFFQFKRNLHARIYCKSEVYKHLVKSYWDRIEQKLQICT